MTIITQSYAMLKKETNPAFARQTLLDEYQRQGGNVAATARAMRCQRRTVYLALEKEDRTDLTDASHAPKNVPSRSPEELERLVLYWRKQTGFGKRRLHNHILKEEKQDIPESTIGAILARHKVAKVRGRKPRRSRNRPAAYNLESLLPFEQCQMDTKDILDAGTLPVGVYNHILEYNLPQWQWTFLDVKTRIRFLAWSHQCTWANGQVFVSLVRWWLASFGFTHPCTVRIDGGREWHANFRGAFERSLPSFYHPLAMFPELIRKGHPQDNGYVERSHGTDDTELYIPWLKSVKTEREFLGRMCWWQQTYNLAREHSGRGMNDRTPYKKLTSCGYTTPPAICMFPTLILDRLNASPTVFKNRPEPVKSVYDPVDYDQKEK